MDDVDDDDYGDVDDDDYGDVDDDDDDDDECPLSPQCDSTHEDVKKVLHVALFEQEGK